MSERTELIAHLEYYRDKFATSYDTSYHLKQLIAELQIEEEDESES